MNPGPLQTLLDSLPQKGSIQWIGIRPARSAPMVSLQQVQINQADGLAGDRFSGRADSPRQVTLIQRLRKNYCACNLCVGIRRKMLIDCVSTALFSRIPP
jgi:hypothetical protein